MNDSYTTSIILTRVLKQVLILVGITLMFLQASPMQAQSVRVEIRVDKLVWERIVATYYHYFFLCKV
jgi:hypothetical protein